MSAIHLFALVWPKWAIIFIFVHSKVSPDGVARSVHSEYIKLPGLCFRNLHSSNLVYLFLIILVPNNFVPVKMYFFVVVG